MRLKLYAGLAITILGVLLFVAWIGRAYAKPVPADSARVSKVARASVEKGLTFLTQDAIAWRKAHACGTCHQGLMTVWTLNEAKQRGYAVDGPMLAEMIQWNRARLVPNPALPLDKRPTYNVMSTSDVYLALAARTEPKLVEFGQEDLDKIRLHIAQRQDVDGSWSNEGPTPVLTPVQESREASTIWGYLGLGVAEGSDQKEPELVRACREKAAAWLAKTPAGDTPQVRALRLLVDIKAGKTGGALKPSIDRLLALQSADGGWRQLKGFETDALATGEALYALGQAGLDVRRSEVRRAVEFLAKAQRADGSFPMKTHMACKNESPIIYLGGAWAVLGMMRCIPATP